MEFSIWFFVWNFTIKGDGYPAVFQKALVRSVVHFKRNKQKSAYKCILKVTKWSSLFCSFWFCHWCFSQIKWFQRGLNGLLHWIPFQFPIRIQMWNVTLLTINTGILLSNFMDPRNWFRCILYIQMIQIHRISICCKFYWSKFPKVSVKLKLSTSSILCRDFDFHCNLFLLFIKSRNLLFGNISSHRHGMRMCELIIQSLTIFGNFAKWIRVWSIDCRWEYLFNW